MKEEFGGRFIHGAVRGFQGPVVTDRR